MPADMNDYFKRNPNGNAPRPPGGGIGTPDFLKNFRGGKSIFIYIAIAVIALLAFARPFAIINSGEVGILVTLGKYQEEPLNPGFHIIAPFVQNVIVQDTKTRVVNYSATESLADRRGINEREMIKVLDSRGLEVSVGLTVQYALRAEKAPYAIATLGLNWEDKMINPAVRDVVRSVIGAYPAEELPQKRNDIAKAIADNMRATITKIEGDPIDLSDVKLLAIILPPKIQAQIEQVQLARQEAERSLNMVEQAKQEARRKAEEAKGLADAMRIESQGRADRTRIEAEAQAKANALIAASLTTNLLALRQIEVQGKFNEALQINKDAKLFLTPGGAVPNIWVDTKDAQRASSVASER
ncbi:MAG: prohibitin family protein [Helicobacteraceae bacterium]|jgi:regulator of protease activity HflC (stomatin/prohibitin superfamily)|nr:prohibitin family protein [Helicobacteraceae bacterium]